MAILRFLGSCSGTEPMPDMKHTSFTIETENNVYWFDAGEGCSRTAYLAGVDLLKTTAIFISHPHEDHIGGLFNLMMLFGQQLWRRSVSTDMFKYKLFYPCSKMWNAMKSLIKSISPGYFEYINITDERITTGAIYEDKNIKVSAIPNIHMVGKDEEKDISYSFKIEIGDKKIVYSGDTRTLDELNPLIDTGCDILLIETGHHKIKNVLEFGESKKLENIIFMHHGREIINDRKGCEELAEDYSKNAVIAFDKMTVEI